MNITRNDRIGMERAHVHAWPPLHTQNIDGWLWRSSGGGSQRANSVSTIDFTGNDPDGAIAAVEARYRALSATARFQTFDETMPPDLPELLRSRGYRGGETTITMFKRPLAGEPVGEIEMRAHAWPEWLEVYLNEITQNRRETNQAILDRIPAPSAFLGCRRGGRIVATALCVVSHGCAVIECVSTHRLYRRQGAAQATLRGLEAWAATQQVAWLGLQVVSTNTAAVALYERLGFAAGGTNRFWVKD
jgi:ribosomal protein S18 acetylase RimI-like enzyme